MQTPSQPGSGSVSRREQHQLPAEDGPGEDCLPALWLPHRPVALERVQRPHATEPLQLRLVVPEVGDSHRGWLGVWKLGTCKTGREEREGKGKSVKVAMEMVGEQRVDGWVGRMEGQMSGWMDGWMDGYTWNHALIVQISSALCQAFPFFD